jgi:hypothetical protein
MIKPQRKKHLQIWMVLALLLPAGIISAWLTIPHPATGPLLQPAPPPALPVVLKTTEIGNDTVRLRSNPPDSSLQLEWINTDALTAPSAIIYLTLRDSGEPDPTAGADIIGRIEGRGTYRFLLKDLPTGAIRHFLLYDIIHHRLIGRVNL